METPRPEPPVDSTYPSGHPDHYVHDPEIALALAEFYNGGPLGDREPTEGEFVDENKESK